MNKNAFVNLVIGDGQIGKSLVRVLPNVKQIKRNDLDFSDLSLFKVQLRGILDEYKIACVINTVAYTDVDKAETEKDLAMTVNAKCVQILASCCSDMGIVFIHYSTDFVFDGNKSSPYTEEDEKTPVSYYGLTKAMGDDFVLSLHKKAFILRISWVYSIFAKNNFVAKIVSATEKNSALNVIDDQTGSPCNSFEIAICTLHLLSSIKTWARIMNVAYKAPSCGEDEIYGVYNLAPSNFTNRFEFAKKIIELHNYYIAEKKCNTVISPCKTDNEKAIAKRPLNSCLDSNKIFKVFGIRMKRWDTSLENAFDCASKKNCYEG